jgi:large subunit ribosomal protein L17
MRHRKRNAKLGRKSEHRNLMLANLVCSLIKHKRIVTTLAKARAARSVAEKIVTLGKQGTLHARRLAAARLRYRRPGQGLRKAEIIKWRQRDDVLRILFEEIAPSFKDRNGGYTRIIKLGGTKGRFAGQRRGDAAQRAILEWVESTTPAPAPQETAPAEAAQPVPAQAEAKQADAKQGEAK